MDVFGKIVGKMDPVFVEHNNNGNNASAWPLIATFDHDNHSYVLLQTGRHCITGFTCNFIEGNTVQLNPCISESEMRIVEAALGIIMALFIIRERHILNIYVPNLLESFFSAVNEVMNSNSKDKDILEEISLKSDFSVSEVLNILLELSSLLRKLDDNIVN